MEEIEIPQYFLCPISLQIMKDPVTAITGMTYERKSIEQWLLKSKNSTCPITNQPLPRSSEFLTPNHTLARLIQTWRSTKGSTTIDDQIPTSLNKIQLQKLVKDLQVPRYCQSTIEKLHVLALESERNRRCMVESGVADAIIRDVILKITFTEGKTKLLEQALRILRLLWSLDHSYQVRSRSPPSRTTLNNNIKSTVDESFDFFKALTFILQLHVNNVKVINEAMVVLKLAIEVKDSNSTTSLGNLKAEFFREIINVVRNRNREISQQAIKSSLHVLIETCTIGRNRMKIVEAGGITELIELALERQEKNITDLIFILLAHLCSCADGREQFLKHAAGIALITKRLLRVSSTTDDQALYIFSLICKYSASNEVVHEMLRVGAVSKLCMVMQADCDSNLKEKARWILRLHSNVWSNSPCIQVYLLTRYQR